MLTRDQEVEICKRIEAAETEARRIIHGFGFTGKEHVALAEKLLSERLDDAKHHQLAQQFVADLSKAQA